MRKLMVTAVAVLGVAVGYPTAEAKNAPQESGSAQTKPQTMGTESKAQDTQMAGKSDTKTQEVIGKVESVSGDSLSIRIPSKLNRKMDRLKVNAQSKIVKDAKPAAITELKEGDEVRVSYQIVGSERQLVSVDATSASEPSPTPEKKTP